MPESVWSVRVLVTAEEARQISSFDLVWMNQFRGARVGGGMDPDGFEDTPYLTYELAASGPEEAERLVHQVVAANQQAAGLPVRRRKVVWVTPMREGEAESHRFLEHAKELFDSESYDLAVVAAQIHFELQLRLLLERAATRSGQLWAKRLIKGPTIGSLRHDSSVATVELLLGVDVRSLPFWEDFEAHRQRRNAIAHEGRSVSKDDARRSIKVVERLWAKLSEAERKSTLW